MRVLLTGATGFIGSSFLSAYREIFEIVTFSFREELDALTLGNVDAIVHLSAIVHQMAGAPKETYDEVNVRKTLQLAQKAKAAGVGHFIFMSSVKVYGEESENAYTESTPCHPKDPYGESKLAAERELEALADDTFTVSVIRTPVVYGEGVKANILKLVALTERYAYLPFGGIDNSRSMVYVGNLIHLIAELLRQKRAGIFLAGDDRPLSTTLLIDTIAQALGKKMRLFPCRTLALALRLFRPALYRRLYGNLYVDNTRTRETLQLVNPYTTREGVEKMVTWYRGRA